MAIQTYASVVPDVLTEVTGVPQPLVIDMLRRAARQFCRETKCYAHFPAPVNVVLATANYAYVLPTETEVFFLKWATYIGSPLFFKPYDYVVTYDQAYPTAQGTPGSYTTVPGDNSQIWLYPVPDASVASALRTSLYLQPTPASTGLEELFFAKYREYIVHGAVQRLMTMADKFWSDPDMAKYHGAEFRKGVVEGSVDSVRSRAEGQQRVQMRKYV